MKTNISFSSYLAQFFLEWEMFQTNFVKKIKTHNLSPITFFFQKSCHFWENVKKNIVRWGGPQMTTSMRTACRILKATKTHTLSLCNAHCFPTATMVVRTRLNVTFNLHWLSCYHQFWTQTRSTRMHLSPPFGKSLKIPSRYKLDSWIRNHSRTQLHFLTTAQSAICARLPQRSNTRSVARCGISARQSNPYSTRPTEELPQLFYWILLDHLPCSLGRFTPGRRADGTR